MGQGAQCRVSLSLPPQTEVERVPGCPDSRQQTKVSAAADTKQSQKLDREARSCSLDLLNGLVAILQALAGLPYMPVSFVYPQPSPDKSRQSLAKLGVPMWAARQCVLHSCRAKILSAADTARSTAHNTKRIHSGDTCITSCSEKPILLMRY